MAATYRPASALDYAKKFSKFQPLERIQARILDAANKAIWMAAPWRWSIGVFAPIALTYGSSDQTIVTMPTDFLSIQRAIITDGQTVIDLHPEAALPGTTGALKGNPSRIAFVPGTPNVFRLYPYPTAALNTNTWYLVVWYKKQAPVIKDSTVGTAGILVMDDEWAHVFEAFVLFFAYLFSDDQRAGNATWADGKSQFTGQMAVAYTLLDKMRASEPLITVFKPKEQEEKRNG